MPDEADKCRLAEMAGDPLAVLPKLQADVAELIIRFLQKIMSVVYFDLLELRFDRLILQVHFSFV